MTLNAETLTYSEIHGLMNIEVADLAANLLNKEYQGDDGYWASRDADQDGSPNVTLYMILEGRRVVIQKFWTLRSVQNWISEE